MIKLRSYDLNLRNPSMPWIILNPARLISPSYAVIWSSLPTNANPFRIRITNFSPLEGCRFDIARAAAGDGGIFFDRSLFIAGADSAIIGQMAAAPTSPSPYSNLMMRAIIGNRIPEISLERWI